MCIYILFKFFFFFGCVIILNPQKNNFELIRAVYGSGQVGFRPSPNPTCRSSGGKKSDLKSTAGINRSVRFWARVEIGLFGQFQVVAGALKVTDIWKKSARICKIIAGKCKNSTDLHQNHPDLHQNRWNLLGMARSG